MTKNRRPFDRTGRTDRKIIRTTLGELIAATVDAVGTRKAPELLAGRAPLQRLLRQRLLFV